MNKITVFLVMIIMALCFMLGSTMQSKAQSHTFVGLLPFVTSANYVGFLDQNTGRVYLYDDNLSRCLFVGQINELGKDIQIIQKAQSQ